MEARHKKTTTHTRLIRFTELTSNVTIWLQGRHSISAIIACLAAVASALLCIALGRGNPLRWVVYSNHICIADPKATNQQPLSAPAQALYTGCTSGYQEIAYTIPLAEIVLVVCLTCAIILLMPDVPLWERFSARWFPAYYAITLICIIGITLSTFDALGKLICTPLLRQEIVIIGINALFAMAFMSLGLAFFGKFYGIAFGLVLNMANLMTQGVQGRAGFMLRIYQLHTISGAMSSQTTAIIAMALMAVGITILSLMTGSTRHQYI